MLFVSNRELLNKLDQVEAKIDANNLNYANYIIEQVKNILYKYYQPMANIHLVDESIISARSIHQDTLPNSNCLVESMYISNKLDNLDVKLDKVYFENQVIKHQLLLEDHIRESINEIDDLSFTIKQTISKIDTLTELYNKNK